MIRVININLDYHFHIHNTYFSVFSWILCFANNGHGKSLGQHSAQHKPLKLQKVNKFVEGYIQKDRFQLKFHIFPVKTLFLGSTP
jgi:hypothetical protein